MKIRLNKKVLADMPDLVRENVLRWREKYKKVTIQIENCTSFYTREDELIHMINILTGVQVGARTAGEYAGLTRLSPVDQIDLEPEVVAVCTGFFCGVPYLKIYQYSFPQLN
jgi:hypothetical protein